MGLKLSEIRKEQFALNELFEMQIDEETGEIIEGEVISQLQNEINSHLISKSGGIISVIKFKELQLTSIDEEIKRLQYIKKVRGNQLDNFKNYVKMNMKALELDKLETSLGTLSLRTSTSTEIDEELIDSKYGTIEQKLKFSKSEIGKLLKEGKIIPGAKLVINQNLQVK